MNRFIVIICIAIGLFLLASLLWLKPEDNPSNYSADTNQQISEKLSESANTDLNIQDANIEGTNGQTIDRSLPHKEFSQKLIGLIRLWILTELNYFTSLVKVIRLR